MKRKLTKQHPPNASEIKKEETKWWFFHHSKLYKKEFKCSCNQTQNTMEKHTKLLQKQLQPMANVNTYQALQYTYQQHSLL